MKAKKIIVALTCAVLGGFFAEAYTAKFNIDWKNPTTVKTTGQLVMPFPSNFNGKMFKGWKDRKTKELYAPYAVVQLSGDADYTPEYDKLDLSKWSDGDGKAKPHKTGQGILYAIGDSITFGTKVGGNGGAWPKFVGEKLGLKVVNDAKAGSRLSQWRSVLTQARNHNQFVDEHIQGVNRDQLLEGVRSAGVIAFTLGTNDLLSNNKGEDVAYRMIEFVEALHHQNPQALIVMVNGKRMEAFQKGGQYEKNGAEQDVYADACAKIFTGSKFKNYCVYIDISDFLAKHSTYENCERNPDGVHPGRDGHKAIAARILEYVTPCANASAASKFALPKDNEAPAAEPIAKLPSRAEMWDFADAGKAKTALREKISLNGLWAISAESAADLSVAPSVDSMKFFLKVPGEWPAGQKPGMAVWDEKGGDAFGGKVRKLETVFYGRKVKVPADWNGRMIKLGLQWVPTAVLVYVDGKKAGEVFFPGGEVDVTKAMTPGEHDVQVFMSKKLQERMVTAFDAPDTARSFAKKEIAHAGINGDVYLAAEPKGVRVSDVQVRSHVKDGKIEFSIGFEGAGSGAVTAVADIFDGAKKVKTVKSAAVTPKAGERFLFGGEWKDAKVWDLDCPENVYTVKVRLEQNGRAVDELYAEEFGFRDIVLKGTDILLNGTPVHFRPRNTEYSRSGAVANEDIAAAMKDGKRMGFNSIVPTSNYGFSEGDVTAFEVMARETSKAGMGLVIGLPHPNCFDNPKNPHNWQIGDLSSAPGQAYDRLVRYMVKRFQNIPGLFYWSSTHNATGYESDQNPAIISGRPDEIPTGIVNWRQRFRKLALAVNEKMKEVDPTRPVYHHESGAEGDFYTLNCYLDWAPIQERSDWFEHWQEAGVMPLIIVEWGTPHIASWSSYRASPKGRNIWAERDSVQQCWLNEFNSAFLGERAFKTSEWKRLTMDRLQYKAKGNKPCYYGYNCEWGLVNEDDTSEVLSMYANRNYKDMRARGVTSFLPWDIDGNAFFKPLPEDKQKKTLRANPFKGIKDFGVVRSDYFYCILDQYGREPRLVAKTLMETYTDILGWIAGPTRKEFTRVNDTFRVGEKVEKSLMFVNDTRRDQRIAYVWKAGSENDSSFVTVKAGCTAQIPIEFTASADTKEIAAAFGCVATGWKHKDTFALNILPAKRVAKVSSPISVFDPEGGAKALLKELGVKFTDVTSATDLGVAAPSPRFKKGELLIIGRNAFYKAPFDVFAAANAGVKVVVLEQDAATLKKLGFRYQEHGLRNLFATIPEFAKLDLTDWRGNATSLPEYLNEDKMKGDWATTDWEGFKNRRVWRAGNRGIVSCVLPEKPTKGNFMPILHGGFDLQYAPVMEYSEPGKRVILSQLDLCSRTETSPEAVEALAKILEYADRPVSKTKSEVLMLAGWDLQKKALDAVGIGYRTVNAVSDAKAGDILVIGPGTQPGNVTEIVKKGVKVLCLNLKGSDVNKIYPAAKATDAKWTEYPDFNEDLATEPLFRGVSNADIQWNYPSCIGNLARFDGGKVLKAFHDGEGVIIFSSISQGTFDEKEINLRHNRRRAQGLITRLIANLGGSVDNIFLKGTGAKLYADKPEMNDDPYRYYRW